jgi:hypothetical protein
MYLLGRHLKRSEQAYVQAEISRWRSGGRETAMAINSLSPGSGTRSYCRSAALPGLVAAVGGLLALARRWRQKIAEDVNDDAERARACSSAPKICSLKPRLSPGTKTFEI